MPKDGRLESYPFYIHDWRSSPRVALLNAVEKCVYRELLDYYWESGFLPGSVEVLFKLCRISRREWSIGRSVINIFFVLGGDGNYHSEEIDEKRAKVMKAKERQGLGAKHTNEKRWKNRSPSDSGSDSPSDSPSDSGSDSPSDSEAIRSRARSPSPSPSLHKKELTNGFERDTERFEREYPQPVSDLDMQNFLSQVLTPEDQELFFRVLEANNSSQKWRDGFSTTTSKYLTTGLWKKMPKSLNGNHAEPVEPPRGLSDETVLREYPKSNAAHLIRIALP